ncbi:helix-turn-helix transcriptional regulator [Agromyces intestinalis]|nr:helix-turn-helix transcriptional regulator [Agromyces intestinalis]
MLVRDLGDLGDLIRRRRTRLKLSQTELADRVGGTRQWVSRVENGKHEVSTSRLFAVLDALGLNLEIRPPRTSQPSLGIDVGVKTILPTEVLSALAQSAQSTTPGNDPAPSSSWLLIESARRLLEARDAAQENPDAQP